MVELFKTEYNLFVKETVANKITQCKFYVLDSTKDFNAASSHPDLDTNTINKGTQIEDIESTKSLDNKFLILSKLSVCWQSRRVRK